MLQQNIKKEGEYESHYRIIKRLGGPSGMGQVYLAYDEHLEKKVAIKYPSAGTDFKRFLIGGKAAARLEHSNIIKIFYLSTDPLFLVMEYLEGGDLRCKLDSGELTLAEKYSIIEKVLKALSCAHKNDVIHRDLKPENIMFRSDNEPVVVDFDLSKYHGSSVNTGSIDGLSMGTPPYMSPEQVMGKIKQIGPTTDIYALGVIIFEIFLGSRNWPIDGDSIQEMMINHLSAPPKSFYQEALNKGLEQYVDNSGIRDLDRIVERALQKEIDKRFKSADEMLQEWKKLSSKMKSSAKFDFSLNVFSCPNCQVKVSVNSRFCHNCGAVLAEVKKDGIAENKDTAKKICRLCRFENEKTVKYCQNCGAVIPEQDQEKKDEKVVVNSEKIDQREIEPDKNQLIKCLCGQQVVKGEKFCPNCGRLFK